MDVLFVEDDADTGDAIAMLFDIAGFDFRRARNGREALEVFAALTREHEHWPDVLMLDARLPDTGPARLVELLAQMGDVPPVVLYSASSPGELAAVSAEIGAVTALRKPCAGDILVNAVRQAAHCRGNGTDGPA